MNFYFDLVKTFFQKYFFKILVLLMLVGILILNIYHVFFQEQYLLKENVNDSLALNEEIKNTDDNDNNDNNISLEEPALEETKYYIDIKGSIKNPGVYQVSPDSIVNDCIKLAGGLLKSADTTTINLSKKVTSEMVIYVPKKDEVVKSTATTTITKTEEIPNNASYDDKTKDNNTGNDTVSNLININTATKEELATLNGIGLAKAADIIEYRNTNGNFKNTEDIKNVSGIGDALFAKIKDYITV